MRESRDRNQWPATVANCANCNADPLPDSYGGRCLCRGCYAAAKRADELDEWPLPPRREGRQRDSHDTAIQRLVRTVGAPTVAEMLGQSPEEVARWFRHGAPDEINATARAELATLRQERERRALAFHRESRRDGLMRGQG